MKKMNLIFAAICAVIGVTLIALANVMGSFALAA